MTEYSNYADAFDYLASSVEAFLKLAERPDFDTASGARVLASDLSAAHACARGGRDLRRWIP